MSKSKGERPCSACIRKAADTQASVTSKGSGSKGHSPAWCRAKLPMVQGVQVTEEIMIVPIAVI